MGPNAAQLDYVAALDPSVAEKLLSPVEQRVVYELNLPDGHRITWQELAYGEFKITELGKIDSGRTHLRALQTQGRALTAASSFELFNPDAPVPEELLALDARALEMRQIHSDLAVLGEREVREAVPAQTADGIATLGSATTLNEFIALCNDRDDRGGTNTGLIMHTDKKEKDKIMKQDIAGAYAYGLAQKGTLQYQVKHRTWWEWEADEVDVAQGDYWGEYYGGFLDIDVESAIYVNPNEKASHCVIYERE